jgi:hypothetical protein
MVIFDNELTNIIIIINMTRLFCWNMLIFLIVK